MPCDAHAARGGIRTPSCNGKPRAKRSLSAKRANRAKRHRNSTDYLAHLARLARPQLTALENASLSAALLALPSTTPRDLTRNARAARAVRWGAEHAFS